MKVLLIDSGITNHKALSSLKIYPTGYNGQNHISEAVLNQNNSNSGQVNEGKKRRIQLVVPGGNMTNLFKLLEEALNHMALFIQPAVYQPQLRNIVLWRNHIAGTMI